MGLINTTEEFRQYVRLNASTEDANFLDLLQADMLLVEYDQLRPLLGDSFFEGLLETVAADGDAVQLRLRYLLCLALANLTMVEGVDALQVQISGSGIQIVSDANVKTAFQWQIDNLKLMYCRKGYGALDKVLDFLDAHATDFPTWAGSPAAARSREFFISSAEQFTEHYNISHSRQTYLALLSIIRKMERFALVPVLGQEYFAELKAEQAAGTLTPENAAIVADFLRPALAHIVMGSAIGEMGFALNGADFELNVFRPDDSNSKEADPGLQKLLDMKGDQALHDGERFLRLLRKKLNTEASAEKYATYFASSAYDAPATELAYITTETTAPVYGAF
jgi:hypothetical protein